MKNKNELIEIQKLLKKQMIRLDGADGEIISTEIGRSGALSQNASAYLKAVATSLRIKELTGKNPQAENTILSELGVLNEEN